LASCATAEAAPHAANIEMAANMTMVRAWRWTDRIIFGNPPWVAAQHSKAMAGDHGLNRDGDAIVMPLLDASGSIREVDVELQRTRSGQNAQLHCR
jgi:hypothetical protein